MPDLLLAGDIGGTKTVLALFNASKESLPTTPISEETFPSAEFDSLEAIIQTFLPRVDGRLAAASFGVAGPVVNGRAKITNLPWTIDKTELQNTLNIETVLLLNDLEAIANGVPFLQEDDTVVLKSGSADPEGAIAVLAPGTGLGEAFLVWHGDRYESYPSEGGHASFSPDTLQQSDLLTFLWQKYKHVSFERVCSGSGIPNLYRYFQETGTFPEPDWLQKKLEATNDKTPIIVQAAIDQSSPRCQATLDLFIQILAGEAANMALNFLATGGVYLGGGIPPRIIPQLQQSEFVKLFNNKGRFSDLLAEIPIKIICNPKIALYGAAYEGFYQSRQSL